MYGKTEFNMLCVFLEAITETLRTAEFLVELVRELIFSIEMASEMSQYLKDSDYEVYEKFKVESFNDKIELSNIFYTAKEKLIIKDASFSIVKGKKYAVHGRNGVGKSSIAKVLMGFDEYKGLILFDGVDINNIDIDSFRSRINYVPQDTRLYNQSIYFNLAFGNDKSYDEIIAEAKKMNIHNEIMTFPDGYNTVVGDFGKNLNGGLRQKIFYTRAFLRDADIFLFDEPTNNLDANNSKFLLEYINDPLYADKTFFVICHDAEIVDKFPCIYRFRDGKVFLEKDDTS
jgi:ABC-type bacteriocin/lantibiotic exporter with double-glycine peptidase domain